MRSCNSSFRGALNLAIALGVVASSTQAQRSPFNGHAVPPADSTGHYRIVIGGHFHGHSNNRSGYPASTLLANLDTINALGAHLFLSTGDLYMDSRKDSARYAKALFGRLHVPFFNAPGNHDRQRTADPMVTEFDVPIGGDSTLIRYDRVLLLDTEHDNGTIRGDQLERLRALSGAIGLRYLFIIAHRPVWAEEDPQYSGLFRDNTRSDFGTGFGKEVYPVLQEIAKRAPVYWISGSLGGQAPSSIFFEQHAPNITYIQCAIRDEPRDALLIADAARDSISWSALSLTGQQLLAPQAYDAAWWRERAGKKESFNWRLLPYLTKQTVLHRAFWWGAAITLLFVLLVRRLLRR
jgi:hypothetical protein